LARLVWENFDQLSYFVVAIMRWCIRLSSRSLQYSRLFKLLGIKERAVSLRSTPLKYWECINYGSSVFVQISSNFLWSNPRSC
jgi:hypothetical protein